MIPVASGVRVWLASGHTDMNRAGFAGGFNSQIGWSHDEPDDEQVFF